MRLYWRHAARGRLARIRIANDQTLPRKVRYTIWTMALDIDDTTAGEAPTVVLDHYTEPTPF